MTAILDLLKSSESNSQEEVSPHELDSQYEPHDKNNVNKLERKGPKNIINSQIALTDIKIPKQQQPPLKQ